MAPYPARYLCCCVTTLRFVMVSSRHDFRDFSPHEIMPFSWLYVGLICLKGRREKNGPKSILLQLSRATPLVVHFSAQLFGWWDFNCLVLVVGSAENQCKTIYNLCNYEYITNSLEPCFAKTCYYIDVPTVTIPHLPYLSSRYFHWLPCSLWPEIDGSLAMNFWKHGETCVLSIGGLALPSSNLCNTLETNVPASSFLQKR